MSSLYFRFKQFVVWHDKCAMKVGTDGVLLGSWVNVFHVRTILDVGTGSGLVALMMAQRNSNVRITAIEIDPDAAMQAKENVKSSQWKEIISVICIDYKRFVSDVKFDLIVSNPPYFKDSLKSPDKQRTLARHTNKLTYDVLIAKSVTLLAPNGALTLIIPTEVLQEIETIANRYGLYIVHQVNVHPIPLSESKRTLLTFRFYKSNCLIEDLTIETSRHIYTPEFIELTKEYYLKM